MTAIADADHCDIESLVQIMTTQDVGRRDGRGRSDEGPGFQKRSAINIFWGKFRGHHVLMFKGLERMWQ